MKHKDVDVIDAIDNLENAIKEGQAIKRQIQDLIVKSDDPVAITHLQDLIKGIDEGIKLSKEMIKKLLVKKS